MLNYSSSSSKRICECGVLLSGSVLLLTALLIASHGPGYAAGADSEPPYSLRIGRGARSGAGDHLSEQELIAALREMVADRHVKNFLAAQAVDGGDKRSMMTIPMMRMGRAAGRIRQAEGSRARGPPIMSPRLGRELLED